MTHHKSRSFINQILETLIRSIRYLIFDAFEDLKQSAGESTEEEVVRYVRGRSYAQEIIHDEDTFGRLKPLP